MSVKKGIVDLSLFKRSSLVNIQEPRIMRAYRMGVGFIGSCFSDVLTISKYIHITDADPLWHQKPTPYTTRDLFKLKYLLWNMKDLIIKYENEQFLQISSRLEKIIFPDFVCLQSLLMEILSSQEAAKEWTIVACKYRDTIYLQMLPDEDKVEEVPLKLTLNVTSMTQLGNHRILYSAPVKPIHTETPGVHVLRFNNTESSGYKKYEMKHWWNTSNPYDLSIGTVFYGGYVDLINVFPDGNTPADGTKFCDEFLNTVKSIFSTINPGSVVKFTFNPTVSQQIQYEVFPEKSELYFLPSWYEDFIEKLTTTTKEVPENN